MNENYWDKLMGDDDHAASYMETYGEGPGTETRFELGNFINNYETVLDVGCGPGWNYDHFKKFGPNVRAYRGLDYSQRFVRVANQRNRTPGTPHYRVGDARALKEGDKTWDVVILQDCLEHTNGYEKPVREALRVAKKRIIISFWHLDDTDNPHINDDGDDGWGAWYDKATWEKFLNTLPYHWDLTELSQGQKTRHFYVIDKQEGNDGI